MWPKQLQLSLRGTWPTLLHNRKRKGCCAAFGFWKSVRALPGQDYKGKMCIAMRESLTEASRHQVQGRVIKWQHFCHLEKSPQSWQKKKKAVWQEILSPGLPQPHAPMSAAQWLYCLRLWPWPSPSQTWTVKKEVSQRSAIVIPSPYILLLSNH